MVRSFLFHDTINFCRYRDYRLPLSTEAHVLAKPTFLFLAWNEKLPWREPKSFTYHWQEASWHGFLQMLRRDGRPEADILFLQPHPAAATDLRLTWAENLALIGEKSGQQGLQRLFVTIPVGDDALSTFYDAGFSRYSRQTILNASPLPTGRQVLLDPWHIRPGYEVDRWAINRFLQRHIPPVILSVENGRTGEFLPFAASSVVIGRQLLLLEGDTLRGLASLRIGRVGSWARFVMTAEGIAFLPALLTGVIEQHSAMAGQKPLYLAVRQYQPDILRGLQEMCFTPLLEEEQLVKYLMQPVRDTEAVAQRVLQGQPVVPAHSTLRRVLKPPVMFVNSGGQKIVNGHVVS